MFATNGTDSDAIYQLDVLTIVQHVCSSISCVGCVFVVVTFAYFAPLKRTVFRLAASLALADIGQQIGIFMGRSEGGPLCMTQSFFIAFFTLATILWPFCIAFTLYLIVVHHVQNIERFEKYYHMLCWGMPFVLMLLPLTTNPYGNAGIMCWITLKNGGRYWQIFQVYGWVWVVSITDAILYLLIIRAVRRQSRALGSGMVKPSQKRHSAELLRLSMYPLILTLCYSFATVNRIYLFFHDEGIFWLQAVHIGFVSIPGFLNSIAYATSPSVRRCIIEQIRKWRGKTHDAQALRGSGDYPNDDDDFDPESSQMSSLQFQTLMEPLQPARLSTHFLKSQQDED